MTGKKVVLELETLSTVQKKDLLTKLFNSLVPDTDPADRQKLLHNLFLTDNEPKPVIEMVEY